MTRAAAQPVVVLFDALAWLLALAIVAIALTGGGVFDVGTLHVSARSVGNPIAALLVVGLSRYALAGTPGWLNRRCVAFIRAAHDALANLTNRRAWQIVIALAAVSLMVKLANAWSHPGFFSGDDVEVQEMSLAAVLDRDWRAWTLRSAFFPMVFVHPAHVVASWLGATETGTLVAAGRTVVALLSTLAVPFAFAAGRRLDGAATGVIAAVFVATSHLLVSFGGTELPRPVSATLLAGAFVLLFRRGAWPAALAGGLVGIAAALRFSEAIFVLPAAVMLLVERRWSAAVVFVTVAAGTGALIQAIADEAYWGAPFFSLRQAIDYTLVQQQSTRGFQPPWHYLTTLPEWSTLVVAALAVFAAWRGAWKPALWAGLPIVVLSALPHKEARYLLPIVPFAGLLAAIGLWRILRHLREPDIASPPWAPVALTAALAASTLISISGFHVQRTDGEVALARSMAAEPDVTGLAVEQLWRWGGRLYLGGIPALTELDGLAGSAAELAVIAQQPAMTAIALRSETCDRLGCGDVLRDAGLEDRTSPAATAAGYRIFKRVRKTPPSTAAAPNTLSRGIDSPSSSAANAIAAIGTTFE